MCVPVTASLELLFVISICIFHLHHLPCCLFCRLSHGIKTCITSRKKKKKKNDVLLCKTSAWATTTAAKHTHFFFLPPKQPLMNKSSFARPSVRPSPYSLATYILKVDLYRAAVECERNSLVYLPRHRGLGGTLLAGMVMRRILDLNPQRQAFFLVETDAQISAPVRTRRL